MPIATTTALLLGTTIAGAGVSAYGQVKAGRESKAAAEYNAQIADTQAEDALVRGRDEESRFRQELKGLIGSQRAGFAAQNIDVGSGSAVDVQADAAYLGELDALTIRSNAAREAWGYKVQAQGQRTAGSEASRAAKFGAASTLLGTGGSLALSAYGSRLMPRSA